MNALYESGVVLDVMPPIAPRVMRNAGITTCAYVVSVADDHDDAIELAAQLLEAVGMIPIPDDLPLACGHERRHSEVEIDKLHRNAQCTRCRQEREAKRRKERP